MSKLRRSLRRALGQRRLRFGRSRLPHHLRFVQVHRYARPPLCRKISKVPSRCQGIRSIIPPVRLYIVSSPRSSITDIHLSRGTLINVRGDFRLARARIIAFEVIKALSDEEGTLPLMENVSMAKIATMLRSAPDTKLKSNRWALFLDT